MQLNWQMYAQIVYYYYTVIAAYAGTNVIFLCLFLYYIVIVTIVRRARPNHRPYIRTVRTALNLYVCVVPNTCIYFFSLHLTII